MMANRSKEL